MTRSWAAASFSCFLVPSIVARSRRSSRRRANCRRIDLSIRRVARRPPATGSGRQSPYGGILRVAGTCRRTRAWTRGTEAICASDMMFASPTCRCGRGHAAISNSRLRRALHDGSSKWKRESLARPAIARRCDRPAGARAHRSAKKRDARGDPSKRSRASLLPHREQRARDHNLPTDAFTS